jgi:energy-coupling factor transport system ATP-binding protein
LAAVLAARPDVLILDEPTGGLDMHSRRTLMSVVAAYNRRGRTVILITHDMRLVAEYAARALVMAGGRIAFDGMPAALFAQRNVLAQARLAVPPVVRLAQRLTPLGLAPGALTCADFAAAWQALAERGSEALDSLRGDAGSGFAGSETPWVSRQGENTDGC